MHRLSRAALRLRTPAAGSTSIANLCRRKTVSVQPQRSFGAAAAAPAPAAPAAPVVEPKAEAKAEAKKSIDWNAVKKNVMYVAGALIVFDAVTYVNYHYTVPRRLQRLALEVIRHHPRVVSELGPSVHAASSKIDQISKPDRKAGSLGAYYLTLEGSRALEPENKKSPKARATVMVQIDQSSGEWGIPLVRFTPHQPSPGATAAPEAIDLSADVGAGFASRLDAECGGRTRSFGEVVWGAPATSKSHGPARRNDD